MDRYVDAQKIRQLLKKTKHFDKDERFMATSDLNRELEVIEGQLSGGLQRPIRDAILGQLDDTSNDVQAIACRCLATCARKFNVEQVDEIVEKVAKLLISGRAELRDIYCIALKTIIKSVVDEYGITISKSLSLVLLDGLNRTVPRDSSLTEKERKQRIRDDYDCRIMCMDITKDLIGRFGSKMAQSHMSIQEAVEPYLGNIDRELRKKAAATLGALVPVMTAEQFNGIFALVLDRINDLSQSEDTEILFTYIQCIGIFSSNAGQRVEPHLDAIMKNLLVFSDPEELNVDVSIKHELLENTLQAFEAIVQQCPSRFSLEDVWENKQYGRKIFNIALRLIQYDPLYNYEVSDIMDEIEEGDDEDDGLGWDDDGDGDWDDDDDNLVVEEEDDADDTSWKVRVAATKCMNGLIRSKAQSIHLVANDLMKVLLKQFREHDPNVKNEVFGAFRELLMATAVSESSANAVTGQQMEESDPLALPPMMRLKTSVEVVDEYVTIIMEQIIKQLETDNVKTKTGILGVLRELVLVRQATRSHRCKKASPLGLSPYFPDLIPQLANCMGHNDILLRQKSLRVLYLIISLHESIYIRPIIPLICPVLEKCTSTNTYNTRVKTQALIVISQLVKVMRNPEDANSYNKEFDQYLNSLFDAAFGQLKIKDIEQEVKQAAIAAAADCLAYFGDALDPEAVKDTLGILLERLDNEITQDAALQAFTTIASSPLRLDLSKVAAKIISNVDYSISKQSQGLRHQTMLTLIALLKNPAVKLTPEVLPKLIKDCSKYIVDEDLHFCHLVLDFIVVSMKVNGNSVAAVTNYTLPYCFKLCTSPLIQGQALRSLKTLFRTYQNIGKGNYMSYPRLKQNLLDVCRKDLAKQSFSAISQCVAYVSMEVDGKTIDSSINQLRGNINSHQPQVSQISLLCIGEIGNFRNLRQHKGLLVDVFGAFKSPSEVVKWAASFALGRMASGSLDTFLPRVLELIDTNQDNAYLLLNSLKEIIMAHSEDEKSNELLKYVQKAVPLLMKSAESDDEGVRTMVAECIGKFACIDREVLREVNELMNTRNYVMKATMVSAIKFALSKDMKFDMPRETINMFLEVLNDDSLENTLKLIRSDGNEDEETAKNYDLAMQLVAVRKQALQTLHAFIYTQPKTCLEFLSELVLPMIYSSLPVELNLQRTVDLGPFKHSVDLHLQIRKSAYQCMDTILESYEFKTLSAANGGFKGYIDALKNGVTDKSDDIQILTAQIFTRLCQKYTHEVLPHLDSLVTPFTKAVKKKLTILKRAKPDGKDAKDADRARDVLRIFTKCMWTMNNLAGVEKEAPKFASFWPRVTKTKDLIPIIQELNTIRNS